ncbi:hypothetical protein GCM10023185_40180 [Hymenobacter saemangeumensis]|uniref:T9SS type A sorting domain-containing protein n=1 Tax=Hymenobacter saemangeumensis TaxID=1084522 RepID=A0ABP8IQZ4_9BACT
MLLALALGSSTHALHAQERSYEAVLDEKGTPLRVKHEIIVRFDPLHVNGFAIDNPTKVTGALIDFVDGGTVEQLSSLVGQDLSAVSTFKIFRNLTTLDTLSIGRDNVPVRIPPLWSAFVLRLPNWLDEQTVCDNLNQASGLVIYAHFNFIAQPASTNPPWPKTHDPFYVTNQASLHATATYPEPTDVANRFHVNVEPAWQYVPFGISTIKVGIMDTGIDGGHPDLGDGTTAGSRVRGGWDYVNQQPFTLNSDTWQGDARTSGGFFWGHGTQCAGIIGALRNNQVSGGTTYVGVAGIASGVSLYSLRIFGNSPSDPLWNSSVPSSAFAGMDRAAEGILDAALNTGRARNYGVHVMNHSWTAPSSTSNLTLLEEAVKTAYSNKVVMVTARGNAGNNAALFPSFYPEVISVSATGSNGNIKTSTNGSGPDDLYGSSYGPDVDLAAPGTHALVYTTQTRYRPSGTPPPAVPYDVFNGTSAAAPHVAGAAALLLSYHSTKPSPQTLHPEDVLEVLKKTARPKTVSPYSGISVSDLYGAGLLDVGKAIQWTRGGYQLHQLAGTDAANATRTTIATGVKLILANRVGMLNAETYTGDVIRSVVTASHNVGHLTIKGAWARNSASVPYGIRPSFVIGPDTYYPVFPYPGITLSAPTTTSATLTGYFYHFTSGPLGPLDVWLPYNPNVTSNDYAYTVWTSDPYHFEFRTAPGDEPGTAGASTSARTYPNPSSREAWVDFGAQASGEQARLELQTLAGQTVAAWQHTATAAGRQTEQLPLAKLPTGLYLCRVTTPSGVSVVRIVKE